MIRFGLYLIVSVLLFAALTFLAKQQSWIEEIPSYFYQTLFFVPFTTFVIFGYLYKLSKPDIFVQLYLLTMVVKFFAYGAYVFFVIVDDKPGARGNVLFFLVLYGFFTVLEIAFLYRKISSRNPQ